MKLAVIGSGYVGLVTGAGFSDFGNHVTCVDIDAARIERLRRGEIPFYEPGLSELVQRNAKQGRLVFTTDTAESLRDTDVVFLAVGTPSRPDGAADLSYLLEAARQVGRGLIANTVVVTKSTVPVGTGDLVRETIAQVTAQPFSVASNPEFLKEGDAVNDFMKPARVIIGADEPHALDVLRRLYTGFLRTSDRIQVMDLRSAELTKYAANAMLATRITFMNELALLAERLGADIEQVRQGIGSDPRIGYSFLYAGCGYGGSCFPKDVKALIRTAQEAESDLKLLRAVDAANERQKLVLVDKIVTRFGADLTGRKFALWGLAFKPDTDDTREAPSAVVIDRLLARGATVCAYVPVVKSAFSVEKAMDALQGADALVICTEWKEFRSPDFEAIKRALRERVIFDGRNMFLPETVAAAGLEYHAIGRPTNGLNGLRAVDVAGEPRRYFVPLDEAA